MFEVKYNNKSYHRDMCLIVLLALGVLALYWPFRNNPLIFDDIPLFESIHSNGYELKIFQLRSFPYATFYWDELWFDRGLAGFRLENIVLHLLEVIAIYFLSLNLCINVEKLNKLNITKWSVCAAAIFAFHPASTYAVGYLVQRTILMATLFCTLSMIAYIKSENENNIWWAWLSVLCYGLAVQAKEHAVALPLIIFALLIFSNKNWIIQFKARWYIFAAMASIGFSTVLQVKGILGSSYEIAAPDMLKANSLPYINSVLTQARLFFKYIILWIIPNPGWMSIDMRERFASTDNWIDCLFLLLYFCWGICSFWLLTKKDKRKIIGFSLFYPWAMFWTEFSTVRVQEIFVLYRSYLWMPGLICSLPLASVYLSKRSMYMVMLMLLIMLPLASVDRLMTMSNPIYLWEDAKKLIENKSDLHGAYRIHFNLGAELLKMQRYDEAIEELKKSISQGVDFAEAHNNIGVAYLRKNDWLSAINEFTQALSIEPNGDTQKNVDNVAKSAYGRARAYEALGRKNESEADYKISCELRGVGCDVNIK
jgi:tetratricopeptide (TPR) repeat protein